jgi:hypothetical protein
MAVHLEKLQSLPERNGEALEEGRTGKLDTARNDDQFNLAMVSWASVSAGLSPVSRTTSISATRTRLEATFSPAQAKDLCRPIGHHGIERVGIEANLCVSKSDFIEQVAGRL